MQFNQQNGNGGDVVVRFSPGFEEELEKARVAAEVLDRLRDAAPGTTMRTVCGAAAETLLAFFRGKA